MFSKETKISLLKYRISMLSRNEVVNFNLLRKARRQLRHLENS